MYIKIAKHIISCLERVFSVKRKKNIQNTKKIKLHSKELRKITNEEVPRILKELKKQSLNLQEELKKSYQIHLYMDNFYNEKVKMLYVYEKFKFNMNISKILI